MKKIILIAVFGFIIFFVGNDELKSRILTLLTDVNAAEDATLQDDTLLQQATDIIDTAIGEVFDYPLSFGEDDTVENFTPLTNKELESNQTGPIELYNVKILDGDSISGTIDINQLHHLKNEISQLDVIGDVAYVTVRYLLTDTSESVHPDIPEPQPFSLEAKKRNATLISGGHVTLEFDKGDKMDKYGRLLCYVYQSNGSMVQEVLIREGYARVAYVGNNTTHLALLENAQKEAQQKLRNIWSIDGYVTDRGFKQ